MNPSLESVPAYYEYDREADKYIATINGEKRGLNRRTQLWKTG